MILFHEKAMRGHSRGGWLDSWHTFSFGTFNDPARMGFGNLRVLNEDWIIPKSGFPRHGHQDMDILSFVMAGEVHHEDSAGNRSLTRAGEIQLMAAGSGVEHSEWNLSEEAMAHLYQIWLIPDHPGGTPRYEQAGISATGDVLLAGPEGAGALVTLGSDTRLWLRRTVEDAALPLRVAPGRLLFAQIVDGLAESAGERISAGDGLQLSSGEELLLTWQTDGAALVFDMAA